MMIGQFPIAAKGFVLAACQRVLRVSIVCAAIKNGQVAIASDSQVNFGSTIVSAPDLVDAEKIIRINDSYVGLVGWKAISDAIEHLSLQEPEAFELHSRLDIFATLQWLHQQLKDNYFIEVKENDDEQPVESSQLDGLVINAAGIFELSSYREVNQYSRYWAVGSGRPFGLGAMHALYDTSATAVELVTRGVEAAIAYDEGCGGPVDVHVLPAAR